MAVCYTVVFSPEEADSWLSFEDREDLGLQTQVPYTLYADGEGERKKYYIINRKNEKIFNVWEIARGDFVE